MKSISVIIVVKNNPPHLFETLKSIDNIAAEIIIGNIDIGHGYKKRLSEIKKVKLVTLSSTVPFADLVKEDLKKQAKGEYVLYLDPDEIFPSTSLGINPSSNSLLDKYDVFYFPRKNIIFGKWIEHSRWWPDYQLRLFRKNSVIWPKQIHPVPQAEGKEYKFAAEEENAILHYNYDNLDQYLNKAIRYAGSEAASLKDYSLLKAGKNAVSEFISRFFAGEGYKDGMHGLVLSLLQMFYYFLLYFYYWEKKKYADIEKNIPQNLQDITHNLQVETDFWLIKKNLISVSEKIRLKILNKISKLLK